MLFMVNWTLLSWVLQGRQRVAVLRSMETPMTPTLIHKICKEYHEKAWLTSTSSVLRTFVREGLAECTNNDRANRRIYKLTDNGMKVRTMLLKILTKPMTTRQIIDKTKENGKDIHFNNVSALLQEFVKIGLAECINPEKKRGRIYRLTPEGEKIRDILLKISE